MCSNVDLLLPDGPWMHTNSPASMRSEMSARTRNGPSLPANVRDTPWRSINAKVAEVSQGSGFEGGFFPISQPQRSGSRSASNVAGTPTAANASTTGQPTNNAQIQRNHMASANTAAIKIFPTTARRWPS